VNQSQASGAAWKVDIAGVGACAAATVLAYVLGVAPVLRARAEAGEGETRLAGVRAEIDVVESELVALRDKAFVLRTANDARPARMQPVTVTNTRVSELTDLATVSGLKIAEMQPGAPVAGPRLVVVPVRMSGVGPYRACVVFLNQVRAKFPDVAVRSFRLSGNPLEPKAPTSVSIDLAWHAAPAAVETQK
jgi:hypothetical protein